jgi:AcrR family transcriptional regulator
MKANLYGVKTRRGYHHGALRGALLAAATALLAEKGVEGFSLRETARRAGVSPAAPKHHFRDVRALLTAIATLAFEELADALETASNKNGANRAARIKAQGMAYVRFAITQASRFDLMWRVSLLDTTDESYCRAGQRAFAALDRLIRGEAAPALKPGDPGLAATLTCWSTVHGFARLAIDGSFGVPGVGAEQAVEAWLPAVLSHLKL